MAKTKTRPYDAAEYLESVEDKALSQEGNPEFATVMKVVRALGLKLRAEPEHV